MVGTSYQFENHHPREIVNNTFPWGSLQVLQDASEKVTPDAKIVKSVTSSSLTTETSRTSEDPSIVCDLSNKLDAAAEASEGGTSSGMF